MTTTKTPSIAHCRACAHEWTWGYLPLPLAAAIKLMKAPCPMCGSGKAVFCGPIEKDRAPQT